MSIRKVFVRFVSFVCFEEDSLALVAKSLIAVMVFAIRSRVALPSDDDFIVDVVDVVVDDSDVDDGDVDVGGN